MLGVDETGALYEGTNFDNLVFGGTFPFTLTSDFLGFKVDHERGNLLV